MWPFDPNKEQMYQRYAQAHDTRDYSHIDRNEAKNYLQQFVQNALPHIQHRIFEQHLAQMPLGQRAELAQQLPPEYGVNPNDPTSMAMAMARLSQERPDLLQRILNHPLLLAGAVGLAALIARHTLEQREA
jgi:hypothetical protein